VSEVKNVSKQRKKKKKKLKRGGKKLIASMGDKYITIGQLLSRREVGTRLVGNPIKDGFRVRSAGSKEPRKGVWNEGGGIATPRTPHPKAQSNILDGGLLRGPSNVPGGTHRGKSRGVDYS